ncbi:hypothetical protein B0G71_4364 [Paraburkholderia sp. BL27I4N3]|uniref:hypothetical protein n=1 Tax=Paraburkholderia sp. BL27I4N3 TaxID=1938805 RepID=UPI000E2400BB|nr:hypothetical protein [Paraburkholderia sp. BL27I4N3]REE21212.1 hypothetical protein B0G71_4364 [Paraburkholderia sp. BL27I4N3]
MPVIKQVTLEDAVEAVENAEAAEQAEPLAPQADAQGSAFSAQETPAPVHTAASIKEAAKLFGAVTVGFHHGMQVTCMYDKGTVPAHTLIVNSVVVDEATLARMLDRAQRR